MIRLPPLPCCRSKRPAPAAETPAVKVCRSGSAARVAREPRTNCRRLTRDWLDDIVGTSSTDQPYPMVESLRVGVQRVRGVRPYPVEHGCARHLAIPRLRLPQRGARPSHIDGADRMLRGPGSSLAQRPPP